MTTQERILHELGNISGQLTALSKELLRHTEQDREQFSKVDVRLSSLEKAKWKLAGAMGAAVFAAELVWRLTP